MYWNNSRSPQMGGQPRQNMNFGNAGRNVQRSRFNRENSCAAQKEGGCCEMQVEINCGTVQREDGCREKEKEKECSCARQEERCCEKEKEKECGCARQEERCCEKEQEKHCGMKQEEKKCCMALQEDGCGCETKSEPDCDCMPSRQDPLEGMPLAMAFVPWQDYKDICSEEESWCQGTIFSQLDLDFMARRCN